MNHDDQEKPNPDLQAFIEPELEARVVASVLGEASAFEAAEIERLCADQPELAIFKRRIDAVHGLAAKAARPEMQPLRLAPERREKILQAIGEAEPRTGVPVVATPRPRRSVLNWLTRSYGIAAGVVLIFFLSVLLIPRVSTVREYSRRTSAENESRQEAQKALIADSERRKAETLASRDEKQRAARAVREAAPTSGWSLADSLPTIDLPAPAPAPTAPRVATTPAPRASPRPAAAASEVAAGGSGGGSTADGDETISLSPFVVTASEDVGYTASSTLAGTRLNTELRDVGSAITVVTPQFLKDAGATADESLLQYTSGTEVTGQSGGYSRVGDKNERSLGSIGWEPGFLRESEAQTRVRGLMGAENTRDSFRTDANKEVEQRDAQGATLNGLASATWGKQFEYKGPALETVEPQGVEMPAEPALFRGETTYDMQPGDTFAALSRRYGVTVADLMRLNGITDPRRLQVGAKLKIPTNNNSGRDPTPTPPPAKPDPGATAPDETSTAVEAVSTFSLHVSDVSFRLAQAALARGEAPDPARIRPEEFYNAFDYGDPAPAAAEKIACRIEQAAHPVLQQRNLVRIAVRVPATGRGAGQPLRLTVLLDTSGSMEREDRAASVRRAMEVLGSLLGPNDRVTVIGFARQPRLLVEALPGDQAATRLAELAAQTPAEGGTNLEAALELALTKAQQYFHEPAQNRVVLITDGAANLGNAEPERLARMITDARERGLAFDACGVGTDGLDDAILEALTRKGDGRYYVLDSPEDADAGFARQLAGAFRPAAQNVKLQVRFNPARVAHYRLIGFEQHRLREEDFRNDQVDAAELAAEEAAVAVYQVAVLPGGEGELGDVFVRFRDTAANEMVERSWTMPFEARARAFDQATPTVQLAGIAALLAEKLRGGAMADLVRFDELAPVVTALRGKYAGNARVQELVAMIDQARRMAGE